MSWSAWIGLALAVLVQIVLIARGWEWVRSQVKAIMTTLEKHERHIMDHDVHWTARERDALVVQLDRISADNKRLEELIQESLTERADVVKVITALIERGKTNGPEKPIT